MVIFRKPVPGLSEAALARFVGRAVRSASLRGEVNVLVTSNRELQALNSRFRGKAKPTDVLSFAPMPGMMAAGLAGDIAISAEIATENARQLGHPAAQEIKILALHGILHLAGYDHETDRGIMPRGIMARKELRLRKALGLPSGLIERNSSASSSSLSRHPSRTRKADQKRSARRTGSE